MSSLSEASPQATIPSVAADRRDLPGRSGQVLALAVVVVVAMYAAYLVWVCTGDGIAPAWSDEFAYVAEARSLVLNRNLRTPFMINELVAKVGQFGSHGFAYAVVDGAFAAATGWEWNFKILSNVILLVVACVVAMCGSGIPAGRRSAIVAVLLTGYILPLYFFTYMQEVLQVTLAVCVFRLFQRADREPLNARWLVGLAAICISMTLFRAIWALAVISGVFIVQPRYRVLAGILAVIAIVSGPLETSTFQAVFPDTFLGRAFAVLRTQGTSAFIDLGISHFAENLRAYFGWRSSESLGYVAHKYWMVSLFVGSVWFGIAKSSRPVLAAGVLGMVTWLAVCGMYDVFDWREQRVLAPCALIASLALANCAGSRLVFAVVAGSFLFWITALLTMVPVSIRDHQAAASGFLRQTEKVRSFQSIGSVVPSDGEVVVLMPPSIVNDPVAILALPLRGSAGQQIRYTANIFASDPQQLYARHGRFPVDYALVPGKSSEGIVEREGVPVLEGEFFRLLKLPPIQNR